MNPWKTKSVSVPYENPWIRIEHHEVINPSGQDGIYGLVKFKNQAIGIVPIDEEGYTYLVGQWRYALNSYEWEIPEGGCPVGTDALTTAQRELKEETGFSADSWEQIMEFHLSNSVTDEYGVAFLARGLRAGEAELEPTEDITVRRLPLEEAIAMSLDGRITDALSILALQRVALLKSLGREPKT
jgi:8-oxo-dGTP pyrophosphatase MutT (NUDIX family)